MKDVIKKAVASLCVLAVMAMSLAVFTPIVTATNCADGQTMNDALQCVPITGPTQLFGPDGIITKIISTIMFLIGVLSVIMLIYGGIRYTISAGDATAIANAKNTILYAIVGMIVATLAYALVAFVLNAIK